MTSWSWRPGVSASARWQEKRARQQAEVRALSARARVTATSFTNEYRYAPQEHRHAQSVGLAGEWGRSGLGHK
jgi:hypothetical protein